MSKEENKKTSNKKRTNQNNKKNYNTQKTQQYEIKKSHSKSTAKTKNNKKEKKGKKRSIFKGIFITLFVLIVLTCLAGAGVFAAIFFSDKWAITKEDLIANGNTEIFNNNGELIAVLSPNEGDGNRKVIPLDQMGRFTPNAYIAIEDKRFYEHSGVDLLRTAKATVSYALHRGSSSGVGGGSTITQQLVKNLMKDKADSGSEGVERKIREMSRAYQIEKMLTKNQIIEKYLNIIYIGGSDLQGVEYGATYYFAKSAKDLDLAESAFLAGINNAPNMYNPYSETNNHAELIKNRTKLVLRFMHEQNRISDDLEEAETLYNEAVAKVDAGLEFKKGNIEIGNMSYFVHEALNQAANDLAEEKDIDVKEAIAILRSSGYKIYTTQDSKIQDIVLKEMANEKYRITKSETITEKDGTKKIIPNNTQAAMVIIDHKTGKVLAMGGALNSDVGTNINYATSTSKQTGSSIKPLANLAPGLEEKVINASTVYSDMPTRFGNHSPKNAYGFGLYGENLTVRKAITVSSNIVNMKIFSNIGPGTVIDYLNQFGLDTYNKKDDSGATLAIGGSHHSSSPLQMAAAYATLANKGEYIEPIFYEKVIDSSGKTVLEPKQEKRRVISEANAFIVSDVLKDVTTANGGTAHLCAISGMDVAAKTGSTDHDTNKWLCGYTPYYAAAVWYGYSGKNNSLVGNQKQYAKQIWANVMKEAHSGLKGKRFEKPNGVVTARVCKDSGKLATKECTNTYTEYYAKGTVPKECDGHVKVKICKESGKVATPYCKDIEEKIFTAKPDKEINGRWKLLGEDKYKIPTETCTIHTEETSKVVIPDVEGKTKDVATEELKKLELKINSIDGHDASKPNGIVLKQSLKKGTKVDKGVTITLTINKVESKPTPTPTEKPKPSEKPIPTEKPVKPQEPEKTEKPKPSEKPEKPQEPSNDDKENKKQ